MIREIKVLIVEDDKEDYLFTKHILLKSTHTKYKVDWESDFTKALYRIVEKEHDVYIVDYNLGNNTGTELVKQVINSGVIVPFIFLTGLNEHNIDIEAMNVGAADYILKNQLQTETLDRSIRYSITQKKVQNELIQANNTKDKLFTILSHDLRTPLANIITLLDIIKSSNGELDSHEIIKLFKELSIKTKLTYNLLENLLSWSQSQLGAVKIEPIDINLDQVCDEIYCLFEANALQKNITIQNLVPKDKMIYADKNTVTLAIRNLLSNAIKFTPEYGTIEIGVLNENNKDIIYVKDNGVGIDRTTHNLILSPNLFFNTRGTNDEKGAGLGLNITREFVERNGGKLWLESEYGKGTTFYFTLQ